MYKIQPVINHIEKVYGLELTPCSIPRSQFQYDKTSDIEPHINNVVKCRSWLGLTEDEYLEIKNILK